MIVVNPVCIPVDSPDPNGEKESYGVNSTQDLSKAAWLGAIIKEFITEVQVPW